MLMLQIVLCESGKNKDKDSRLINKYLSLPFPMAEWKAKSHISTLLYQVRPRTVFLFGITPGHCKNK